MAGCAGKRCHMLFLARFRARNTSSGCLVGELTPKIRYSTGSERFWAAW
jgi:hypothetical protein